MEKDELIRRIIEKEWPMFHSVNGEKRVDCQEDRAVFEAMRRAQFTAWSFEAAEHYLHDLENAEKDGRNLAREKYIRMMKSTDPAAYEAFKTELPEISAEQEQLVREIWSRMLIQTERMRERYPAIALTGRPLLASEEADGWASIETYQCGELATYSVETLKALLEHLEALEKKGLDLAMMIQKNSIIAMGYRSMEEAEKKIAFQYIQEMGGGECSGCGAYQNLGF